MQSIVQNLTHNFVEHQDHLSSALASTDSKGLVFTLFKDFKNS